MSGYSRRPVCRPGNLAAGTACAWWLAALLAGLAVPPRVAAAEIPAQPVPAAARPAKPPGPPGAVAGSAGVAAWTIDDVLWDRPRSAEVIRTLPAVRGAVAALLATADASLVIHHGGGQNDGLRADELRHWLVALAVEPGRVVLAPAASTVVEGLPRGTLVLELVR